MVKKQLENKITDERNNFKPFNYPWAYEAWLKHEQSHWLHTEVPMLEDVKDWKKKLTKEEKQFLTHIFRFFTQGDIDVAGGYVKNYLPYFPQPEVRMMLLGFGAREALHIAAYSHLIDDATRFAAHSLPVALVRPIGPAPQQGVAVGEAGFKIQQQFLLSLWLR